MSETCGTRKNDTYPSVETMRKLLKDQGMTDKDLKKLKRLELCPLYESHVLNKVQPRSKSQPKPKSKPKSTSQSKSKPKSKSQPKSKFPLSDTFDPESPEVDGMNVRNRGKETHNSFDPFLDLPSNLHDIPYLFSGSESTATRIFFLQGSFMVEQLDASDQVYKRLKYQDVNGGTSDTVRIPGLLSEEQIKHNKIAFLEGKPVLKLNQVLDVLNARPNAFSGIPTFDTNHRYSHWPQLRMNRQLLATFVLVSYSRDVVPQNEDYRGYKWKLPLLTTATLKKTLIGNNAAPPQGASTKSPHQSEILYNIKSTEIYSSSRDKDKNTIGLQPDPLDFDSKDPLPGPLINVPYLVVNLGSHYTRYFLVPASFVVNVNGIKTKFKDVHKKKTDRCTIPGLTKKEKKSHLVMFDRGGSPVLSSVHLLKFLASLDLGDDLEIPSATYSRLPQLRMNRRLFGTFVATKGDKNNSKGRYSFEWKKAPDMETYRAIWITQPKGHGADPSSSTKLKKNKPTEKIPKDDTQIEKRWARTSTGRQLLWTYNTGYQTLQMIASGGKLQCCDEKGTPIDYRGLRFRLGIDSQYGECVFVMKKNFERLNDYKGVNSKEKKVVARPILANFYEDIYLEYDTERAEEALHQGYMKTKPREYDRKNDFCMSDTHWSWCNLQLQLASPVERDQIEYVLLPHWMKMPDIVGKWEIKIVRYGEGIPHDQFYSFAKDRVYETIAGTRTVQTTGSKEQAVRAGVMRAYNKHFGNSSTVSICPKAFDSLQKVYYGLIDTSDDGA